MNNSNQIIIALNKVNHDAINYCTHYTVNNAHPIYYDALYQVYSTIIEMTNAISSYEERLTALVEYLNKRARALRALYKKTQHVDYYNAAYVFKHHILPFAI